MLIMLWALLVRCCSVADTALCMRRMCTRLVALELSLWAVWRLVSSR